MRSIAHRSKPSPEPIHHRATKRIRFCDAGGGGGCDDVSATRCTCSSAFCRPSLIRRPEVPCTKRGQIDRAQQASPESATLRSLAAHAMAVVVSKDQASTSLPRPARRPQAIEQRDVSGIPRITSDRFALFKTLSRATPATTHSKLQKAETTRNRKYVMRTI